MEKQIKGGTVVGYWEEKPKAEKTEKSEKKPSDKKDTK